MLKTTTLTALPMPGNNIVSYTCNNLKQRITETTAEGRNSHFSHDITSYQYNEDNQLLQQALYNGMDVHFSYDSSAREASRDYSNVYRQQTSYDSNSNILQDTIQFNNQDADISYLYADNIDDSVAFIKNQQRYYYVKDRLNSVRAITNEQGHIVETYHYSAFGLMTIYDAQGNSIAQSALGNPYTYTGRRYDNETGLYYYRNRMYSAELGRFISEDPLGYEDGFNLYAYAKNNPLKYVDPMGTTAMPSNNDGFESHGGCYSLCDFGGGYEGGAYDFSAGYEGITAGTHAASDSVAAQEDTRTWGSYLPGVKAGDSAARHWADQLVAAGGGFTDDPVASTGLFLSVLWTEETAATTGVTLGTAGASSFAKLAWSWKTASGAKKTTILGENMKDIVIPYAKRTGARTLPFGTTAEKWSKLTPKQRWKLNDGALRKRINEGDNFKYTGRDPGRNPAKRKKFDLTGSELPRLKNRGISYETVTP